MAEFARASDAVAAGLVLQTENTESNALLEDDLGPRLRIGISLGEVVIADSTVSAARFPATTCGLNATTGT